MSSSAFAAAAARWSAAFLSAPVSAETDCGAATPSTVAPSRAAATAAVRRRTAPTDVVRPTRVTAQTLR